MPCQCGSVAKPSAPPNFVIFQADISDLTKVQGLPEGDAKKTDNLRDIFENKKLVPIAAFLTPDFCSRAVATWYEPVINPESTLFVAAFNSILDKRWNEYCQCKTPCPVPEPTWMEQFKGGQCPCVSYHFTYDYYVDGKYQKLALLLVLGLLGDCVLK